MWSAFIVVRLYVMKCRCDKCLHQQGKYNYYNPFNAEDMADVG